MSDGNADLAQLIGSRICHDLISPIGAISNGIELMQMADPAAAEQSPELALIEQSCKSAAARIRLYRIAFGAPGGERAVTAREIASILSDVTAEGRVQVIWDAPRDLPRAEAQLAFLGFLCFETALPRGGTIHLAHDGVACRLSTEAADRRIAPELWGRLSPDANQNDHVTAAQVQFQLLPERAARLHRTIAVSDTQGALTLTV